MEFIYRNLKELTKEVKIESDTEEEAYEKLKEQTSNPEEYELFVIPAEK